MRNFLIVCFLFFSFVSKGQKDYELKFTNDAYQLLKKNPTTKFKDSLSVLNYLKDFRYFAIQKGYLLASVDSIRFHQKTATVSFFLGQKFKKARLELSPEDALFLKRISTVREKLLLNLSFSPSEISKSLKQIQSDLENNGYPFAQVSLENLEIGDEELNAKILIQPSIELRWKTIHLKGESFVSAKLISSYIQIREGDLYSQAAVRLISQRLKQIAFVDEIKPAEVLFTPVGCELFLYLKSKPISLANGVVGLQPNPVTNKVSLTGELRLKLVNVLKRAELLDLNWRSIQAQTQSLNAHVNVPNLFRTSFGVDGQFQLYKRDSTFLELKSTLGVQYALKQGNYLKVFYRNQSSSTLSGSANNPNFSNVNSTKTNFYGIGFFRQQVDYLPNPSRGIILYSDISIGSRKSRISDTSQLITETTFRGELQVQYYQPLAKRHVLKLSFATEFYEAPTIYQNEVFRFGGQISQRGFNEEQLYATSRALASVEYHFVLDQNSFLFAFFDQSWYENRAITYFKDTPYGFGAGLSFGTNIGTFSISYALGSQNQQPIKVRDGKVHFGYIAYF